MSEQIDAVERMAKEALADLQREYQLRAQPYIDMLCWVESLKPSKQYIVFLGIGERNEKNPPPVKEREKSRRSD